VIDCGRVRELINDRRTSTPKLIACWCARASAKQRAGRAGRVQPGLCLKLFSSHTEQQIMQERSEPELKRIPLEEVCLTILATGLAKNCKEFLGRAPEPPPDDAIVGALKTLSEVGAVSLPAPDLVLDRRGGAGRHEKLTSLGRHLARLPVDVRVGKMLIYGALFLCIEPIVTIAACLSASKSVFVSSLDDTGTKAKQSVFLDQQSDFLTLRNVYEAYRKADAIGKARAFCRDNCLNNSSLREIQDARIHYLDLLCRLGFLDRKLIGYDGRSLDERTLSTSTYNSYGNSDSMIHTVILSGMYPNCAQLAYVQGNNQTLMQRTERLAIHSSSVNSSYKLPSRTASRWMVFHEKFGTSNRVSVSISCFIEPIAIMLFGTTSLDIKHTQRKAVVDGWIELEIAAKTACLIRELRNRLDVLLKEAFDDRSWAKSSESVRKELVAGVARLVM
jgi:HrpA-like RNA helicase